MINNIFDSHCHYDDEKFNEDRDTVLSKLKEKGVSNILHAAVDIKSSLYGIKQADKYDFAYTSIGIHPENLEGLQDDYIDKLKKISENSKVKAIGEIGLDYYWTKENKEKQIEVFENQLILANQLHLPVIVHAREATADTLTLLKKYKPQGVIHCFSGSAETAKEMLSLGLYISFTGVITFKNSKKAREALMVVPDDRLLLETDCPYMAPEPNRGKRCDSSMIAFSAQKIGELKNQSPQEVINKCTENTKRLFNVL